jgi:hypothetical protein
LSWDSVVVPSSVVHLCSSLVSVLLVGVALAFVLKLVRGFTTDAKDQQQKPQVLFEGDLVRLIKSTPLVALIVLVAGLVGDGVMFSMECNAFCILRGGPLCIFLIMLCILKIKKLHTKIMYSKYRYIVS